MPAHAQDPDRLENCGYTYPVEQYVANVSGLRIALTANDRVVVNDRLVAEHNPVWGDRPPVSWHDSADTAAIAVGRREVLVRTNRTDCIDLEATRVYVIGETGALRAAFTFPFLWERELLAFSDGDLIYAADYYCEFAQGAPEGEVWIHVLRAGGREFVRQSRPRAEVCSGNEARVANPLNFMPMQAVPPSGRSTR